MPIYVFLGEYTGKTVEGEPEPVFDFMQHYLQKKHRGATFLHDERLKDYLWKGRLTVIFDGLNELPPNDYATRNALLKQFMHDYSKTKFIFTCRTLRDTRSFYKTITLTDLDNEQIKRFIMAYLGKKYPEKANELCQDIIAVDDALLRIYRNPFVLHMLVGLGFNKQHTSVPHSLSQLFDQYITSQLDKASTQVSETTQLLTAVAFEMQNDGKFAGIVSYEWLQKEFSTISPDSLDNFLKGAQRAQLIDYTPNKDIRFYHQILQEYFAAVALCNEWEHHKNLDMYISDYRWQETLLVCAGIVKETEEFIYNIWSPGKESPETFWIALKAVGSCGGRQCVSQPYFNALLQEASQYLSLLENASVSGYLRTVLVVDTIKALSYIEDDSIVVVLRETFEKTMAGFANSVFKRLAVLEIPMLMSS